MKGIFVTRGARFSIPPGGLILPADGEPTLVLHVSYDTYPQWLSAALEHAEACERASKEVDAVWTDGSRAEEVQAVEAEVSAGMQACVAAAVAVDGFYGTVRDRATLPAGTAERWRESELSRPKQIAETFRLCFQLRPEQFKQLRTNMIELFKFRDEAVHPTGATRQPVPHPRLPVAVDRALGMFSAANAIAAAHVALGWVAVLLDNPKPKQTSLAEHCAVAKTWVAPIVAKWEGQRGKLYERRS